MTFQLESSFPWMWALILMGLVIAIALARRGTMSSQRLYLSVGIRLLIVLILCLVMTNPMRTLTQLGSQTIILLLDQSDSISEEGQAQALTIMQNIKRMLSDHNQAGLITFAQTPTLSVAPTSDFELRVPQMSVAADATDIASALEFGMGLFPNEGVRTMVLLSDGNQTRRDARAVADLARQQNIVIHTIPLARKTGDLWSVDKLFAPARVAVGERFRLRGLLTNHTGKRTTASVVFRKNGEAVNELRTQTLEPGTTPVTMDYKITEPGLHAFDLTVTYPDGTLNTAPTTFVDTVGKPAVLIVSPDKGGSRFFSQVIRRRAFEIEDREAVPETLDDMLRYDCIVLNDVGRDLLTDDQILMLQRYVQDFGGGLVTIGGGVESSLEVFANTPLEDLLPVELSQRHTLAKKRRDFLLMLLIDRSGSMEGEKLEMAKASAINAIRELEAGDSIGIIAFDDEAHWVVELTSLEEDKTEVIQNVLRLTPGGGTDARMALVEAYRVFSTKNINIRKHIILMTDGITTRRQLMDITRRVAEKDITISTIAIGMDSEFEVLDQIRQIGKGEFHRITNFSELPRIVVGDMDEQVKEADDIDEKFTPEIFEESPILSGISQKDIPSLKGYVNSRLKVAATKPLMTNFKNTEDPILAHWFYGLGRSTVMMAGVNSAWSEEWLQWRNFGKLWEQIIRWTMRTRSNSDYFFQVRHDGNRLRIRVEIDQDDLPSMLRGSLRLPDNRIVSTPFKRVERNVFEGAFAVTDSGMSHLALLEEGRADQAMWFGQVFLPGVPSTAADSQEIDGQPPDYRLLQDLASSTDGLFLPEPGRIVMASEPVESTQNFRNPLMILVVFLFLIDVGIRRVDIPFRTIWRQWRIIRDDIMDMLKRRLPGE